MKKLIAIIFIGLSTFLNAQKKQEVAYFASGCFWCVEAIFESVEGVNEAVSGYAGGHTSNPTYQKIGTGTTGHAETVAVYYNPKKVSFATLVKVFFGSHDPTTVNGQHPDYGTQYRSIAFYSNASEKKIIDDYIKKLNTEVYKGKIVTEVTKFTKFYEAEAYHQNYERLNPNNPYVRNVSIPRLNRFKKKFPELLKKGH
ncbi:peptide-methionine (S)-S-oxide reductase MsrA [Tenacibaculum sp. MEBiC06402]|uniref:peptide-methionine (S)-S-oxide reductase MsrA n=1 Tax=unclassified Tenacibaculum TaxID=2635139 RepID=UPI003B998C9F